MSYSNPTQSRHKPLEGKGCFNAKIYFKSILLGSDESYLIRNLFYEYIETVNGLEVFIENPDIQNASSLDEDVRQALRQEFKDKGVNISEHSLIINFYQPAK